MYINESVFPTGDKCVLYTFDNKYVDLVDNDCPLGVDLNVPTS